MMKCDRTEWMGRVEDADSMLVLLLSLLCREPRQLPTHAIEIDEAVSRWHTPAGENQAVTNFNPYW